MKKHTGIVKIAAATVAIVFLASTGGYAQAAPGGTSSPPTSGDTSRGDASAAPQISDRDYRSQNPAGAQTDTHSHQQQQQQRTDAQSPAEPGAMASREHAHKHEQWINEYTNRLKDNLGLNEQQTEQVRQALDETHQHAEKKRTEKFDERMKQAEQQRDAAEQRIAAVLTPEQRQKYEANKDQWRRDFIRDNMVSRLRTDLALNDQQAQQIGDIIGNAQQQSQQARKQHADDQEKQTAALKDIHQDTENKIEGVLTPEQKDKFAQLQAKRAERHAARDKKNY